MGKFQGHSSFGYPKNACLRLYYFLQLKNESHVKLFMSITSFTIVQLGGRDVLSEEKVVLKLGNLMSSGIKNEIRVH